jgi:hypothetical protein
VLIYVLPCWAKDLARDTAEIYRSGAAAGRACSRCFLASGSCPEEIVVRLPQKMVLAVPRNLVSEDSAHVSEKGQVNGVPG